MQSLNVNSPYGQEQRAGHTLRCLEKCFTIIYNELTDVRDVCFQEHKVYPRFDLDKQMYLQSGTGLSGLRIKKTFFPSKHKTAVSQTREFALFYTVRISHITVKL